MKKTQKIDGVLTTRDVVSTLESFEDDAPKWREVNDLTLGEPFEPDSEIFVDEARRISRRLCLDNPFAVNAIENRINFAVGFGHKYQATARFDGDRDADLARRTQDVLVDFVVENDWFRRQQEILRRYDRDGEVFLRLFRDDRRKTVVRFVEPEQVKTPPGVWERSARAGIVVDKRDAEKILGFWIDGKLVDGAKIQHRKANVDSTARRGVPLLYPVRDNLRRAQKLLRNMSVVAEIQSSIAMIRKHANASQESVRRFVREKNRDVFGDTRERFQPGTIVDATAGIEYEFPIAAVDASRYVQVLQAELRAVASRLTIPEFMLSSDASNANYSSTTIAEGPAVRSFERLQHELIKEDMKIIWRVVEDAILRGALPEDVASRVAIQAIPPSLAVRDRLNEARADEILMNAGIISRQTAAMRYGLDPNRESALRRQSGQNENDDKNAAKN